MSSKREAWVDYVKVFACILVVLGHFFQSMVKAKIIPQNDLYTWFNTTIYYFHVPLFFICSGYLYQKYSVVDDWKSWKQSVVKKTVALGVPYFVFSFTTWILKSIFASSVNTEIGGLGYTLFIHPTAPYWYLYVLFLFFLVTLTIKNSGMAIFLVVVATILKVVSILGVCDILQIYAVSNFASNWIWFVLGMLMSVIGIKKMNRTDLGYVLFAIFIVLSTVFYHNESGVISFALGLMACSAVVMIANGAENNIVAECATIYTMPIFLMHTLFAAPVRIVLLKVGVNIVWVQVVVGIAISFIGPIVAMKVLNTVKLDWLIYPERLLKKRKLV